MHTMASEALCMADLSCATCVDCVNVCLLRAYGWARAWRRYAHSAQHRLNVNIRWRAGCAQLGIQSIFYESENG